MSIVVESVSAVATATSSATLTITKPTGLAVGDLLVANITAWAADGNTTAASFNTPAGWTEVLDSKPDSDLVFAIQYKIANAGDVAASNFTFTTNAASDQLLGQLIRASGVNTLDPVGTSSSYTNIGTASATFAGTLTSYTPGADGALVVVNIAGNDINSGRTVSAQTLTSGATMTEGFDASGSNGSSGAVVSSAYGVQTTAAAITGYGATFSLGVANHFGQIVVFLPPVNATGTNTLVTTITTAFGQSGTCDTNGTNVLAEATGESFAQSGQGASPTQWTNEAKPSTTWVNEEK